MESRRLIDVGAEISPAAGSETDPWFPEAQRLGRLIHERALRTPKGHVTWRAPESRGPSASTGEPTKTRLLGFDFYGGVVGVAFFLSALARTSQTDEDSSYSYRELVLLSLAPLRRQLERLVEVEESARPRFKLGAMSGLGGYLYGFARIGCRLGEPELLDDARRFLALVNPEAVQEDRALDLAHGSAGLVLALLRLHQADLAGAPREGGEEAAELSLAVACGEHLLRQRRRRDGSGPRGWPANGRAPLGGLAHGAAGIAYALAELHAATEDRRFLEAAREGLEFERSHFDSEVGNWRDLRFPDRNNFLAAWCHGAAGITLGRLAMLGTLGEPGLEDEIRAGLAATREAGMGQEDFLCCGSLGRAETLLQASRSSLDPELRTVALESARDLARRTIRRARDEGYRSFLPEGDEGPVDPGFLRGASGAGYLFLRLTDPELPCALTLE